MPRLGRIKTAEQMPARLTPGTFARIDKVLKARENRAVFVRQAIDAEIARREADGRKQPLAKR